MTFAQIVDGNIIPLFDFGVIPLLYALAFIYFLIGIARFFFSPSEEARESGKQFALWGLIGLAVIFGVWGIIRVLLNTLLYTTGAA